MNSEVWLRAQYQAVVKERDQLQDKVRVLERDNSELKRAVQDLSLIVTQRHPEYALHVGERKFKRVTDIDVVPGKSVSPQKLRQNSTADDSTSANRLETRLECELRGHVGSVYCGQYSWDGRLVASGGLDQTVRIWDSTKGYKQVCSLADHSQLVSDILWTHVKPSLFSCSYDKSLRCYDVEKGVCVSSTRLRAFGNRLAHSASSGVLIALCSSREWFVLDPRNLSGATFIASVDDPVREAATYSHRCLPTSAVCLDDGFSVVLGDAEGSISVFDLRKGSHHSAVHSIHETQFNASRNQQLKVLDLAVCSDANLLAAQCSDNAVRIFDLSRLDKSGGAVHHFKHIRSLRGHETSHWPIRIAWHRGEHFLRRTSLTDALKKQQRFSGGSVPLSPTHRLSHESRFTARRSNSMNALMRPMQSSSSPPIATRSIASTSSRADDEEDSDGFDCGSGDAAGDGSTQKLVGESSSDSEHDTEHALGISTASTAAAIRRSADGIDDSVHGNFGVLGWEQMLVLATGSASGKIYLHDVSEISTVTDKPACSVIDASSGGVNKINGISFGPTNDNSMISYGSDGIIKAWSLSDSSRKS